MRYEMNIFNKEIFIKLSEKHDKIAGKRKW